MPDNSSVAADKLLAIQRKLTTKDKSETRQELLDLLRLATGSLVESREILRSISKELFYNAVEFIETDPDFDFHVLEHCYALCCCFGFENNVAHAAVTITMARAYLACDRHVDAATLLRQSIGASRIWCDCLGLDEDETSRQLRAFQTAIALVENESRGNSD